MAEENAAMREKLSNAVGRDEKGLSAETLAAREEVAKRSAADKAAAEARMKAQNVAHKARLIEAGAQGRDVKSLSDETEAARVAVAERVALEKKLAAAKMAEENAEMRDKLANTTARQGTQRGDGSHARRRGGTAPDGEAVAGGQALGEE